MNCPHCKTPTLITLSPVSWFCSRCGKLHSDFRLDGIDDLKAPLDNGERDHTQTATQGGEVDEKMQRVSGCCGLGGNDNENTIGGSDRDPRRGEDRPPASYELKAPSNPADAVEAESVVVEKNLNANGKEVQKTTSETSIPEGEQSPSPQTFNQSIMELFDKWSALADKQALMISELRDRLAMEKAVADRAIEYLFNADGGCPLDVESCMHPSKINDCKGEELGCWRAYFEQCIRDGRP